MRALLPALLLVWGAAIVINSLIQGPSGSGSYAAGQTLAIVLGAVMAFAGARRLFAR